MNLPIYSEVYIRPDNPRERYYGINIYIEENFDKSLF